MSEPTTQFDPSKYLTRVSGSDYLEVKWRLLWLRQTHPDAAIETELVSHSDNFAIFRAKVSLPEGGSSSGWGSEGLDDFRDYIEKAETKAIGRALAALGFGTQFCPDFEFGAAHGRVVDSPIDFASTRGRRAAASGTANGSGTGERRVAPIAQGQNAGQAQPATPSQVKFIQALAREIGLSDEQLNDEATRLAGHPVGELGRRDASALIEWLQSRRGAADLAS
jgi:hypothetical protein